MPEMYFASTIISSDPTLNTTTALVTDGRYSGAMRGPCVGHVAPEALDGGPIALVEEDDLIEINIPERRLAIVGDTKRTPPKASGGECARRASPALDADTAAPQLRHPVPVCPRRPRDGRWSIHHLRT
jgi:dihydroxy-acid dehydratase